MGAAVRSLYCICTVSAPLQRSERATCNVQHLPHALFSFCAFDWFASWRRMRKSTQNQIKLFATRVACNLCDATPPHPSPPSPATSTEGRRSQLLCQLDADAAVALLRVDAVAAACNASNAMQNGKHTHTHRHTTYTHTGLSYFKAFSCCFEKGNSSRLVSSRLVSCLLCSSRAESCPGCR